MAGKTCGDCSAWVPIERGGLGWCAALRVIEAHDVAGAHASELIGPERAVIDVQTQAWGEYGIRTRLTTRPEFSCSSWRA